MFSRATLSLMTSSSAFLIAAECGPSWSRTSTAHPHRASNQRQVRLIVRFEDGRFFHDVGVMCGGQLAESGLYNVVDERDGNEANVGDLNSLTRLPGYVSIPLCS